MPAALGKIIGLQRSFYGPDLIRQCKAKPALNSNGDSIPLQFLPAKDPIQLVPSRDGEGILQVDEDLLELGSKSALDTPLATLVLYHYLMISWY